MSVINQAISFVHISDMHLGLKFENASFSIDKGEQRRRELVDTFYRVILYIAKQKIDFLFITGDAFESKYIRAIDLADINYNFSKIADCQIIIIAGNHDPLSNSKIYDKMRWQKNVHIIKDEFKPLIFEDKKCAIRGNVFKNEIKAPLDFAAIGQPIAGYHNILLLHGNVFNDDDYCYIDKQQLLALNYDYIGLGHIHKPQFIAANIAYAGSLEPLDFGELGEHGFILGTLADRHSFQFIPFSKRKFVKVDITVEAADVLTSIVQKIAAQVEGLENDFVRIAFSGYRHHALQLNGEHLANYLSLYHFEVVDLTRVDIEINQIISEHKDGFIAEYVNSFSEQELADSTYKKAFEKGIIMLYEAQTTDEDK